MCLVSFRRRPSGGLGIVIVGFSGVVGWLGRVGCSLRAFYAIFVFRVYRGWSCSICGCIAPADLHDINP